MQDTNPPIGPHTMAPEYPQPRHNGGYRQGIHAFTAGVRLWAAHPRLMLLGAVPALLVSVAYIALLVWLATQAPGWSATLTGFAANWPDPWSQVVQVSAGVAVVAAALVVAAFTFVAVTLAVAGPFNDHIVGVIDRELGAPGTPPVPLFTSIGRGIGDGIRMLGLAMVNGLLVLLVSFIPLVGPIVAWVLGAYLGGRTVAAELTATPADARGLSPRQRRLLLAANRKQALSFGVCAYLALLVPLAAVVVAPAAAIGGLALMRQLHGEPLHLGREKPPTDAGRIVS